MNVDRRGLPEAGLRKIVYDYTTTTSVVDPEWFFRIQVLPYFLIGIGSVSRSGYYMMFI